LSPPSTVPPATAEAVRTELEPLAERAACSVSVRIEQNRAASEAIADVAEEEGSTVVITVCDDAAENCPYIPAEKENLHRGFEDPSAVEGTDDEKQAAFRCVRDALTDWIDDTFGSADRG